MHIWDVFAKIKSSEDDKPAPEATTSQGDEKVASEVRTSSEDSDTESLSKHAQAGVQKIEATTSVWSKSNLILAYVLIWIIYFVSTMQQGMTGALTPYVTSSFQFHSLTAATSIMSSIIGGLFKLVLAKILDIWGRPQGFILMVFVLTVGLIMMAACQDVETYAAAQVFYWIGYNGMNFSMSIFIADTSSLKNRSFMFAFSTSPYIITSWISGPLASAFLNGPGFRWGFGTMAIIEPIVAMPLFFLFVWNYRKAKKLGVAPVHNSGRTTMQSIKHYLIEFDAAGLLLLCGGLALFLLPFSLYSYQSNGWQSAMIICMILFGGLLLIAFALYEKFIAPVTFIPFDLLKDRTVLGANILAAVLFIEFYIWNSYFFSFLQVVNNLSITEASYVGRIYTIGSCFWALVVGLLIRWSGRFKWIALYFGLPITILGCALMIAFRQPGVNVGYIAMCQIFIALGGGALVITEQLAAMAATSHQYVAVVLAVEGMFASVGGAIGSTVAAAIWTGTFPGLLQEYLPASAQGDYLTIYADITEQLSYPVGSPTRDAINRAYGESQRYMLIAAATILIAGVFAVLAWRDLNVKNHKQVKGRVF
ncbi:MFS siderochrome iron transporter 1 [Vermiconidia calcicola]|uniref:MFS siderochrome iron transporter 1 n=1 Tax=Vermiconidia calcicola TaxID=1690605 RepID=A0ACC3MPQ3_9PEZI|nr:MFS siderochrome iron transporter 1 [Vermiconidia calcicola]